MPTAMVWGASGGIGRALVQQLDAAGWQVIAVARQRPVASTPQVHWVEADVSSPYAVAVGVQQAAQLVESINFWIYTVGDITSAKVGEMAAVNWQQIIDANLTGAFLTTHYSLPLLAEDAHLLYVGAISERLQLPGLSAYVAAKRGLEAYVEVVRKEQRKQRVTLVRPPAVATAFWEKVPMRVPANALTPDAVAQQILAAYTNGTTGVIDLGT